ncbi:hypothetical protein ACI3QN_13700, partial [Propionibacterium freudenreichii]|uniref:hypothetical protein n=1 Tax=Propionibacterium freudenreichii TaxID=1744 RepID=UPI003854CA1F
MYADAGVLLTQMAFPDTDRCVVYNSRLNSNLVTTNLTVFNPQDVIAREFETGYQGRFSNFDYYTDE